MREFRSLSPRGIAEDFDAEIHGEQPVVEVKESKEKIVISFSFPGFYISDHKRDVGGKKVLFKQVNIGGTGFIMESGKPLLPSFGRYVQIPPDCSFNVSVKKSKPVTFDDMLIYPSQTLLTDSADEEDIFEFDQAFYKKPDAFPKDIIGVTGPFDLDDYSSILLNVCPFQYFPSKRSLIGYGNVTVTFTLEAEKEDSTTTLSDPATNTMASGNLFVNPVRMIEERVLPGRSIVLPPIRRRGPEYLIIYHSTFKKAAEKLANWKNMRGLRTEIVPITDVGNSVDKIKKYIRLRRGRFLSRLRYVLLFGDVDHIVTEIIHSNATDHYYSTKNDPTNGDYVLPWLAVGRIPVRTAAEGVQVVDQIIRYEKTPPMKQDYYDRMAFAAFLQDNDNNGWADRGYTQTMEDIRQQMILLGFDVERIYFTNSSNPQFYVDGTPIPADVIAAMVAESDATAALVDATSEGQLIIGHRDHGGTNGWSHPSFTKTDLDSITGHVPSIFYSLNCQTGKFDIASGAESFAEKLLRIDTGAPSLIACTRNSNTWLNNYLMKALFDAMWGTMLPTFPGGNVSYPVRKNRLGDILNYGKSYLPLQVGTYTSVTTTKVQDHMEIYHTVGDPTLELWKEEPRRIRIRAYLRKGYLYIRLQHCPVDAVITIWNGHKLIKRIVPTSTFAKISLRGIVPMLIPFGRRLGIRVCFSAPGYRFVQIRPQTFPHLP